MAEPNYEPGSYWGKVTRQAMTTTSNGNPQFVLTFEVIGKINPADPDGNLLPVTSHEESMYRVITDKTIEFVLEDLAKLGYFKSSFRYLDPNVEGFVDFSGKEFEFYCKHETYKGQVQSRWSLSRGASKPLENDAYRKLDALFGKDLKELASKQKKSEPEPEPEPEESLKNPNAAKKKPELVEDEIPF